MSLQITHIIQTVKNLDYYFEQVQASDDSTFDLYRGITIQNFELSLAMMDNLLRQVLKTSVANPSMVDHLGFDDALRLAEKQGFLSQDELDRCLAYRANRSSTTNNDGEGFANKTSALLAEYIVDIPHLALKIQELFNAGE